MKPEGVSMSEIPARETSNLMSEANLWRGLHSPGNSVKSLQNQSKSCNNKGQEKTETVIFKTLYPELRSRSRK